MTGTLPLLCSTATWTSCWCSSTVTVGDSPVVPTTTIAAVPASTCQSISARYLSRSSDPSSCIGVTMATRLPLIIIEASSLSVSASGPDGVDPERPGRVAGILAQRGLLPDERRGFGIPRWHDRRHALYQPRPRRVDEALLERK